MDFFKDSLLLRQCIFLARKTIYNLIRSYFKLNIRFFVLNWSIFLFLTFVVHFSLSSYKTKIRLLSSIFNILWRLVRLLSLSRLRISKDISFPSLLITHKTFFWSHTRIEYFSNMYAYLPDRRSVPYLNIIRKSRLPS